MKPIVIINFKAYPQTWGKRGIKLAKICEKIAKQKKVKIIVAPQETDLALVAREVRIPVFAQHIGIFKPNSFTGHITAEAVRADGGKGSLINHSEKRLSTREIKKVVQRCRKNKLITVVCAPNLVMVKKVAKFSPDYIAYEPPELIGGRVSVTKAKPEVVKKAVDLVKKINPKIKVLCGAGVRSKADVKKALELGARGILVASDVVKARNPEKELRELVRGFKEQ